FLLSPNTKELVAAILAGWRKRCLVVPIDVRMTVGEVLNVAAGISAKAVLLSRAFAAFDEVQKKFEGNQLFICLEDESAKLDKDSSKRREAKDLENLDFDALTILTSGTTGKPKGAVHDFHSLMTNLVELGELVDMGFDRKIILPLPISHIFGMEVASVAILFGGTVIFVGPKPEAFVQCVNDQKPFVISGVPLIYGSLLSVPPEAIDLSHTKVLLCGGAPLPITLAEDFESRFGKRLNNGYGSTESKIIALNIDGPVESVGKPVPSTKVSILGEDGNPVANGHEGEIVIKSDILMNGYLDQPEKTAEVLDEKGYKTGDIGYLKDGYLFISGRGKEMIVVGGNKVFPNEVEDVLRNHPLVREVAVKGVDHSKLGQIVKAIIVLDDDAMSKRLEGSSDEQKAAREEVLTQLKGFSKENLKRELRPMVWDIKPKSQPLPKTLSGKVDTKKL
ncbi:MAG: fatty acid--CoA ligase family protein, partial [Cyanobacteria bacterium]|nr:fatty acid--CoA ligase family protein [Cyanobacteriota bacterium]